MEHSRALSRARVAAGKAPNIPKRARAYRRAGSFRIFFVPLFILFSTFRLLFATATKKPLLPLRCDAIRLSAKEAAEGGRKAGREEERIAVAQPTCTHELLSLRRGRGTGRGGREERSLSTTCGRPWLNFLGIRDKEAGQVRR